jgi:hypothetical protein
LVIYSLAQHHGWSFRDIEEHMVPYERDLYTDLLKDELEKKEQQQNDLA